MKKLSVVVVVVLSLCLVASLAFASSKGTIKSVDAKAGSVVITVDGKDMTYKADKGVDLGKAKAGDKVEFMADKDVVKEMKVAKPKAAVGC
jgi:Cu/Ag efflux protein CusF